MPRLHLIAALVTAAALIAPAAASAQAPGNPQAFGVTVQSDAAAVTAQIKALGANIAARNEQIKALQQQIAALRPIAGVPRVAVVIQSLQAQIDVLVAANQQDMNRLQALQKRLNELTDMLSNMMKKMSDTQASLISNIR